MKHLHVIIMLAFSFFYINGFSNTEETLINFSTAKSSYEIYEGEQVTICLEGATETELQTISNTDIQLEVLNGWNNFNNPTKHILVRETGNCFHFKAKKSTASNPRLYDVRFSSENNDISLPPDIKITVKKVNNTGVQLSQNNLFIKGIDSSVDNKGSDKLILGNTVPITQFTTFSVSSYQNMLAGTEYAASYNFMYTGDHPMDDNGIFCILIND